MDYEKIFDPESYTSAVDRIKEFRENQDIYAGWGMTSDYLGVNGSYVGFKVSIISDNDYVIATGHCFRKVNDQSDYQAAETIAYSRALANAGILIGKAISSKEEMEDLFPQSPKKDLEIEELLKSGKKK